MHQKLEEIKQRNGVRAALKAASTKGEWRACGADRGGCQCGMVWAIADDALVMVAGHHVDGEKCVTEGTVSAANAAFCAAAHNDEVEGDIEWLLGEVDGLLKAQSAILQM